MKKWNIIRHPEVFNINTLDIGIIPLTLPATLTFQEIVNKRQKNYIFLEKIEIHDWEFPLIHGTRGIGWAFAFNNDYFPSDVENQIQSGSNSDKAFFTHNNSHVIIDRIIIEPNDRIRIWAENLDNANEREATAYIYQWSMTFKEGKNENDV